LQKREYIFYSDQVNDKIKGDSAVTEEERVVAEAVELKESVLEETVLKSTETENEPMGTEENVKALKDPAKSIGESEKKTDEKQSALVSENKSKNEEKTKVESKLKS